MFTKKVILTAILFFGISTACRIPTFGQSDSTPTPVVANPATSGQATELGDMVSTDPNTGATIITVSEEMLGGLLSKQMETDPSAMLSKPVVTLRDGRILIGGTTNQAGLELNTEIIVLPSVSSEGLPVISIETVKIGPMEAPEGVRSAVAIIAQQMFANAIGNGIDQTKLQSITIENGVMVVTLLPNQ
jgi:hypothetical protein